MSKILSTNLWMRLAAVLIVSFSIVPYGSAADKVVMNLGWSTSVDSEWGALAKKFKELAHEYTSGSVDVKLRCCSQIGGEDSAFNSLKLGVIDAYIITQNNISPHWSLMDVFVLPYVFESADHAKQVFEGEIGKEVAKSLYKDTNVHLLTYGGVMYRDLFNSKHAINSIEDMDGLKIRVPKNSVMIDTFRAFGAEPVPLAWSETPTALQTRTIDGGDNGTSVIRDVKFYEFAKYLTVLDHFMAVAPLFASDRFMSKLDDDQREAVLRAAREAGAYQAEVMAANREDVRTWLVTKGGMEITRPDRADFITAVLPLHKKIVAERGKEFQDLLSDIKSVVK